MVALLLALAVLAAGWVFGAVVLVLQLTLLAGVLALLDAPAPRGALGVGAGAALVADVVVRRGDGDVGPLAGVVALGLIAALVHQLALRDRARVTEALADTLVLVVLGACAACLLALRQLEGGRHVAVLALTGAGAALLAGRVVDRVLVRPALAVGATRGWPGLVLGLGVGAVAAVLVPAGGPVAGGRAALVGLAAAAVVAAADLAVDLAAVERRTGRQGTRLVAASWAVGLLLPFALLGPVALVAGLLVTTS